MIYSCNNANCSQNQHWVGWKVGWYTTGKPVTWSLAPKGVRAILWLGCLNFIGWVHMLAVFRTVVTNSLFDQNIWDGHTKSRLRTFHSIPDSAASMNKHINEGLKTTTAVSNALFATRVPPFGKRLKLWQEMRLVNQIPSAYWLILQVVHME